MLVCPAATRRGRQAKRPHNPLLAVNRGFHWASPMAASLRVSRQWKQVREWLRHLKRTGEDGGETKGIASGGFRHRGSRSLPVSHLPMARLGRGGVSRYAKLPKNRRVASEGKGTGDRGVNCQWSFVICQAWRFWAETGVSEWGRRAAGPPAGTSCRSVGDRGSSGGRRGFGQRKGDSAKFGPGGGAAGPPAGTSCRSVGNGLLPASRGSSGG